MSKRRIAFAGAALTLALAACTKDEPDKRAALTQREKDSILGASTIPGAKAVKKTLTVADSVAARQQRMIDTAQ